MIFYISCLVLSTLLGLGSSSVVPAKLETRARGDRDEPYDIRIDCSRGSDVCNDDCYAILCLAAPNPVRFQRGHSNEHRRESGYRIFQDPQDRRERRGIDIPDEILERTGRSGEESIMANTEQGGEGEILFPTRFEENRDIGAALGGQLRSAGVQDGDWYKKIFTQYTNAPYCDALQQRPPDHSVCSRKGKKKWDPAWTAVMRRLQHGRKNLFLYHQMNFDDDDRWTGKFWNNGKRATSKQEEPEGNE